MDLVSALATKQQEAGGFGEELHRPHPCKASLNIQKFLCTTRTYIAYIQLCRLPTKSNAHGQGKAALAPKYIQEVTAHVAPLYATWDVTCNRCNLKPRPEIWKMRAKSQRLQFWLLDFKPAIAATGRTTGGWEETRSKIKNRKTFFCILDFLRLRLRC